MLGSLAPALAQQDRLIRGGQQHVMVRLLHNMALDIAFVTQHHAYAVGLLVSTAKTSLWLLSSAQ